MSAIETMRSIGRPIAYHPALAGHVGGVNAAIFLCQMIYWDDKAQNEDLGVYKTAEEWELETGLSYREQAGARKKLRDLGLLTETNQRLQHRIYYKLEHDAFDALMQSISAGADESRQSTNANFPNDESAIGGQPKAQFGDDPKRSSLIGTKTTTETTTENISSGNPSDVVDAEFELAWSTYPKRAGGNSKVAARKAWQARLKAGIEPDDMVAGVQRYAAYCQATERTGTQFVQQAATFFGPDLHFENDFDIPSRDAGRKSTADRNADWNEKMRQAMQSTQPIHQPMKDMGTIDASR